MVPVLNVPENVPQQMYYKAMEVDQITISIVLLKPPHHNNTVTKKAASNMQAKADLLCDIYSSHIAYNTQAHQAFSIHFHPKCMYIHVA